MKIELKLPKDIHAKLSQLLDLAISKASPASAKMLEKGAPIQQYLDKFYGNTTPAPTTKTRDYEADRAIFDRAIESIKALRKLDNKATEEQSGETPPTPSEYETKAQKVRRRAPRGYYPNSVTPYYIFKLAGWDHLEVSLLTDICNDKNIPLIQLKGHSSYRVPDMYVDMLVKVLKNTMPRNPNAKTKIIK